MAKRSLMGDSQYSGALPTDSWVLTQDGMGAHLYERGNVGNRNTMGIFGTFTKGS